MLLASRHAGGTHARVSFLPFRDLEYSAGIYNAGTRFPFVLFYMSAQSVQADPAGAVIVRTSSVAPPVFARPQDRAAWQATAARIPIHRSRPGVLRIPRGTFSFTPQGLPLTYHEARMLPSVAAAARRVIEAHLRPLFGSNPPATALLTAYGFLLAHAPLSGAARTAIFTNIADLPGLQNCGSTTDSVGRHGVMVCEVGRALEVGLVTSPVTGAILAIEQRTARRLQMFADLPQGTLVESDTFVGWGTPSSGRVVIAPSGE